MLSREEIEGELRDVFAKMSPVELERELNGAWRELVEEELANRLEAGRMEASRLALLGASRPAEKLTRDALDVAAVAFIEAAPSAPPLKANWRSRIAAVLRAILKRKPH